MQHEMMRLPASSRSSDNIGDVLASIRQLIAQDSAVCRLPDAVLNAVPAQAAPLILDCHDLIAPLSGAGESRAGMPAHPDGPCETPDNVAQNAPSPMPPQMEETMLHANASVTPITPAVEPQAATGPQPGDGLATHLFTPEDKAAQKGTHLRGMIREAIRQELQGEIGNRLSRNLQVMIRQEVELTLRQMCEQD